jgi:hypothetical protein
MKQLAEELKNNFDSFKADLKASFLEAFEDLEDNEGKFLSSYKRLASLEAWRAYLLEPEIDKHSLEFFIEAQNDALLSHTFARIGSWRAALKSLRSVFEDIMFCLYYKDHPVEYKLWEKGKGQLPISDYIKYFERHPAFDNVPVKVTGVSILKKEYSTLSKAVHGSSKLFRMTLEPYTFPSLMVPETAKLNQWLTRERKAIQTVNQLLLSMFSEHLQGAKLRDLRKAISFTIPNSVYAEIRTHLGIRLFKT